MECVHIMNYRMFTHKKIVNVYTELIIEYSHTRKYGVCTQTALYSIHTSGKWSVHTEGNKECLQKKELWNVHTEGIMERNSDQIMEFVHCM